MIKDVNGEWVLNQDRVIFSRGQGRLGLGKIINISSTRPKPGHIVVQSDNNRITNLKLFGHWIGPDQDWCDRICKAPYYE